MKFKWDWKKLSQYKNKLSNVYIYTYGKFNGLVKIVFYLKFCLKYTEARKHLY